MYRTSLYSRVASVSLVLIMCFSLTSCAKKQSGITIDDLEEAIEEFDDDASISKRKSGDGYSFTYSMSLYFAEYKISGTADSDENLTSVVMTCEDVDVDIFNDLTISQLTSDYAGGLGNVPIVRLEAESYLAYSCEICDLLSPESDEHLSFLLDLRRRSPDTDGEWEYSITSDESDETITITAEFVGE